MSAVFGDVVRELRAERGLSQEAVSLACGRHRTYVSLLERGRSSPSLDTVWTIAEALSVEPSEIVLRIERQMAAARRRTPRSSS